MYGRDNDTVTCEIKHNYFLSVYMPILTSNTGNGSSRQILQHFVQAISIYNKYLTTISF